MLKNIQSSPIHPMAKADGLSCSVIVSNGPAGTYVFGMINDKMNQIDSILDIVKWNPIAGVNGGEIKLN